nr:hypothetical protein [uncultured Acinetobacter sp.]
MTNSIEKWNSLKEDLAEKISETLSYKSPFTSSPKQAQELIAQSITDDPVVAKDLLNILSVPISVADPIDKGARELLLQFSNSWLEYPALEVEYLLRTLGEHITNCLTIKEKAQELEVRTISETSSALLQKDIIDFAMKLVESAATNQQKFMGNASEISIKENPDSTFKIQGTTSANDYWVTYKESAMGQLLSQAKFIDSKIDQMKQSGSGLNYPERFNALKNQFNIELKEAYLRAISACAGLQAVYGIDYPLPEISDIGYLDALALWTRGATYKLEKELFNWNETTILLALNSGDQVDLPKIMTTAEFNAARANGTFIIKITPDMLNRLGVDIKNTRLRGVDLIAFVGDGSSLANNYWRARIDLPEQTVTTKSGAPWTKRPTVILPQVTYPSVNKSLQNIYQREIYNSSPYGEWTIRIEPRDFVRGAQNADASFTNLILKLSMSSER